MTLSSQQIRTRVNRAYAAIRIAEHHAEFQSGWPVDTQIKLDFEARARRWWFPVVIVPGNAAPQMRETRVPGTVRSEGAIVSSSSGTETYTTVRELFCGIEHECLAE